MSNAPAATAEVQPDWSTVLDEYERVLDRHAAAMADAGRMANHAAVEPFDAPPAIGPLPEALRPRAVSLAARTRELTADAQRLVDQAPAPIAAVRPRPRRQPRSASFDQRA